MRPKSRRAAVHIVVCAVVLCVGAGLLGWKLRADSYRPVTVVAETGGVVPVPEIYWPYGKPYGRLENNRWAQTYIEFSTRYAAAYNARNFSDPRLSALIGDYHELDPSGSIAYSGNKYLIGPRPMTVLDVVESDDGTSAQVTVCEANSLDWLSSAPAYGFEDRRLPGRVQTYTIADEGGDLRVEARENALRDGSSTCTLSMTRVGYFIPMAPFGEWIPVQDAIVIGYEGEVLWPEPSQTSTTDPAGAS